MLSYISLLNTNIDVSKLFKLAHYSTTFIRQVFSFPWYAFSENSLLISCQCSDDSLILFERSFRMETASWIHRASDKILVTPAGFKWQAIDSTFIVFFCQIKFYYRDIMHKDYFQSEVYRSIEHVLVIDGFAILANYSLKNNIVAFRKQDWTNVMILYVFKNDNSAYEM